MVLLEVKRRSMHMKNASTTNISTIFLYLPAYSDPMRGDRTTMTKEWPATRDPQGRGRKTEGCWHGVVEEEEWGRKEGRERWRAAVGCRDGGR